MPVNEAAGNYLVGAVVRLKPCIVLIGACREAESLQFAARETEFIDGLFFGNQLLWRRTRS